MFLLVPAHPGSPGQKAVKWLCVCVCVCERAVSCTSSLQHSELLRWRVGWTGVVDNVTSFSIDTLIDSSVSFFILMSQ